MARRRSLSLVVVHPPPQFTPEKSPYSGKSTLLIENT